MANVKELKVRIKSTKNTLKITRAMKLVSAAKLARAQAAVLSARPYAQEIEKSIKTISALVDGYSHPYLKSNESKKSLCLVISSDRGLCGGYNSNLAKKVRAFKRENSSEEIEFVWLGKKVRELLQKELESGKTFEVPGNEPGHGDAVRIAKEIAERFSSGEIGRVFIAYNQFRSAINFIPTVSQVLPMQLPEDEKKSLREQIPCDFLYEPNAPDILDSLIPDAYQNAFYTFVLDALAAEHGSRMNSMENATKNCKEMIRKLTLKANKLRQAAITTQLIEVVSGAESLNG